MSREEAIGAGYAVKESSFNWYHFAHILKDLVRPKSPLIYYGEDYDLIPIMRDKEFGIESWQLYYGEGESPNEYSFSWLSEINGSYFGSNFCDTLVSVNYEHSLKYGQPEQVAGQMYDLVQYDGEIILINPGFWASDLNKVFRRDPYMEIMLKRYSMLANENVVAYSK